MEAYTWQREARGCPFDRRSQIGHICYSFL